MAEQQRREIVGRAAPQAAGYPGPWKAYSDTPDEMPLSGYATIMAVYLAVFGSVLGAGRRQGLPLRITPADVVLFGVATHKIGRIVTKDWVTSPLRAPFTRYTGSTGGGEVSERSRGAGLRRAVGDLLTCPWCIAPWVAGGLYSTFLLDRRAARLVGSLFASVAVSDVLQHAYGALKRTTS
jgi:hypothetical protein